MAYKPADAGNPPRRRATLRHPSTFRAARLQFLLARLRRLCNAAAFPL